MAVEIKKSSAITSRDADAFADANISGGMVREFIGQMEALTTDSVGSTYIFGSIPSNARVSQILLSCDDSGTTGAMDIGIYKSTKDGSAVVDADFFASAQLLTTALVDSNVTHESAVYGIEDQEQKLWQALGLSSDPGLIYDVVGTLTAVVEANATVALKGKYLI